MTGNTADIQHMTGTKKYVQYVTATARKISDAVVTDSMARRSTRKRSEVANLTIKGITENGARDACNSSTCLHATTW